MSPEIRDEHGAARAFRISTTGHMTGPFIATSPDLALDGGSHKEHTGNSTKMALNWGLILLI